MEFMGEELNEERQVDENTGPILAGPVLLFRVCLKPTSPQELPQALPQVPQMLYRSLKLSLTRSLAASQFASLVEGTVEGRHLSLRNGAHCGLQ